MLATLRPIKQRVIIEPTWDNRRVAVYADWMQDNFNQLVVYYTKLVGIPEVADLGPLKTWVCGKWCDQKMLSRVS